jgi:putative ABC transport system permease protein
MFTTYLPHHNRGTLDITLDARVLGFTLIVSILTGLLFGLMPAWQATRLSLTASLKDQSGASLGWSRLTLNKLLVVVQVALSLYLLVGAGLFVHSLRNLRTLDVGFNYDNIVHFSLDPGSGYNSERYSQLYKQLLTRLEALPGAHSATLLKFGLLGNFTYSLKVTVPGYTPGPDEGMNCNVLEVGPRFFEMMKMPILMGRDFSPQDERALAPPDNPSDESQEQAVTLPLYAVINQAMARSFFGNENPVGKHFIESGQKIEIIGVVKDAKYATLQEQSPRTYYLFYFQQSYRGPMRTQLRTNGETADYAATIRRLVHEIDPQLRIVDLQTMAEAVDELLIQERFIAQTASAFSLFALLLACIGLYGVMSYAVTRRTNEIGIRIALGATVRDVVWLVMREASLLVMLGVAIGLTVALATTRYVSSLLFGLTPTDPLTITTAILLMIGVAALAGYLPARRAMKVDPLVALRYE